MLPSQSALSAPFFNHHCQRTESGRYNHTTVIYGGILRTTVCSSGLPFVPCGTGSISTVLLVRLEYSLRHKAGSHPQTGQASRRIAELPWQTHQRMTQGQDHRSYPGCQAPALISVRSDRSGLSLQKSKKGAASTAESWLGYWLG